MTEEVGKALGTDMVWDGGRLGGQHSRNDKLKHIEVVCKESAALREVVKKYPWFLTLLKRARLGELARNRSVSTKLVCIEEKHATAIGNNLTPCLKSRKVILAGVDQWKLQNRAVGELFEEFPWMEDMFVALGKGVVKSAPWGMMFRVIFGALTSLLDLGTDIYVTNMFWNDGKWGYFVASCVSLSVSIGIQLLLVYGQNRKLGWQRVFMEAIPVLTGLKPAVDAYHVAKGLKQKKGTSLDTISELTYMKCIEMFGEAIPGVIIQLMAIVTIGKDEKGEDKEVAVGAWISLAISALSTGYTSAVISYDYDTDPGNRQHLPSFYGYVPTNPKLRSIVFASMIFFCSGVLMIRSLTIVLLSLLGMWWAFAFVGADLVLYLTIKLLRNDFWYWVPLGGNLEILMSFLCRVIVKIITDFTSIIQFRHSNEVGGLYWTFGFLLTMASLPITIKIYEARQGDESIVSMSWRLLYILTPSSLTMFSIFFYNMDKRYWQTFYSTQRGKDLTIKIFRESNEDGAKASYIFERSTHHWFLVKEEVKSWVKSNWSRWEEEKPNWLDDNMRAKIPVQWLPIKKAKNNEKEEEKEEEEQEEQDNL
mmetsp:Transcript_6163/g.12231  ORF Transcript_6163/g.12231 Transcript_6163/m.12231 type:complete len:592 (+) Transcript_6163:1-1776(+)